MRSLLVLGCGGHGRVVADVARACGYEKIAFLDDAAAAVQSAGARVLGPMSMIEQLAGEWPEAIAAVGHNDMRFRLLERLRAASFATPSVVHPSAIVSSGAEIGSGIFIAPGAIVNVGTRIGEATIVNTGARIDHDCTIGPACHIAPGATLSGGVTVGARAWLGTGCAVRQNVTIGEDALVGVGAAVVHDLVGDDIYVGVPARPLQRSK